MRSCIRSDLNKIGQEAMKYYEGDKVVALIAYLNSDKPNLEEICKIIWALGELGDPRALSALKNFKYETDSNYLREIYQYELERAISKIEENRDGTISMK